MWPLALLLTAAAATAPDAAWEATYAQWRKRDSVSLATWRSRIPAPVPAAPDAATFANMTADAKQALFFSCLNEQTADFTARTMAYQPPDLNEVGAAARAAMRASNKTVTVAVFWGRERYVSILWKYLERNLKVNKGIVDKVLLVSKSRNQDEAGAAGAQKIVDDARAKYPDLVVQVPMCTAAYGCAFDEVMPDNDTVYVKMDDDIIFIKDGSIEHLVLAVLTNSDYSFYSGSVVNNPHSFAVHKFVGAMPVHSYHWKDMAPAAPPYVPPSSAGAVYYGKNMYDAAGSQAHESFIYNAAHGRLDVYGFDIWNQNQCRCGLPQKGLDMCNPQGYYHWNVNVFAYLRGVTQASRHKVPAFDEPEIGMGWPKHTPPHRVGMLGEALFVHCQFTLQRQSKPDFGLREDILLPWYHAFADQYLSKPWGGWQGNATLLPLYESMAWEHGEDRFGTAPHARVPGQVLE